MSRRSGDSEGRGRRNGRTSQRARGRKDAKRKVKRVRCVGGLRKRNHAKHVGGWRRCSSCWIRLGGGLGCLVRLGMMSGIT